MFHYWNVQYEFIYSFKYPDSMKESQNVAHLTCNNLVNYSPGVDCKAVMRGRQQGCQLHSDLVILKRAFEYVDAKPRGLYCNVCEGLYPSLGCSSHTCSIKHAGSASGGGDIRTCIYVGYEKTLRRAVTNSYFGIFISLMLLFVLASWRVGRHGLVAIRAPLDKPQIWSVAKLQSPECNAEY